MSLKCSIKTDAFELDYLILIVKSTIVPQRNSKHVRDWASLEFATGKLPNVLSLAPENQETDFPAISKHEIGGVVPPLLNHLLFTVWVKWMWFVIAWLSKLWPKKNA